MYDPTAPCADKTCDIILPLYVQTQVPLDIQCPVQPSDDKRYTGANMKQNNYDISRYDDEYFFSIIYVIIMVWEYIFDGV